ncbi:MAG TPA: hypothetical protein VFS40_09305 [Gemmatimonadales bacterium]|nr:hypothetical protein [Gemmatimonadales bacterium]
MQPDILRFPTPEPTPPVEPEPPRSGALPLPTVFVPPTWSYRHLTRPLAELAGLDAAELDRLGTDGWELAGIVNDGQAAHFFFKRLLQ